MYITLPVLRPLYIKIAAFGCYFRQIPMLQRSTLKTEVAGNVGITSPPTTLYGTTQHSSHQLISRLELITNVMHNFIYSIITLHRDPQHVSSIAVLTFRTICVCTVSGIVTPCMLPSSAPQSALNRCTGWQHTGCDDA
jgi:hypothetical protein